MQVKQFVSALLLLGFAHLALAQEHQEDQGQIEPSESSRVDVEAQVRAEEVPSVAVPTVIVPGAMQAETVVVAPEPDGITGTREFVVYVVRHAEREEDHVDPGLTADGYRRADGLAQMLSNANIERIYSTQYRRSVGTVLPLARVNATAVEFYSAGEPQSMLDKVIERGQNTVIVGHSNTVAGIVQALGGEADELSEERYGDVFQLFIHADADSNTVNQVHLMAPLIMQERRGR